MRARLWPHNTTQRSDPIYSIYIRTGCSRIPPIRSHKTKVLVPTNYIVGISRVSWSDYLLEVTRSRRFWRDPDDRHRQVCKNQLIVTKFHQNFCLCIMSDPVCFENVRSHFQKKRQKSLCPKSDRETITYRPRNVT
jgi:hypothetical protein